MPSAAALAGRLHASRDRAYREDEREEPQRVQTSSAALRYRRAASMTSESALPPNGDSSPADDISSRKDAEPPRAQSATYRSTASFRSRCACAQNCSAQQFASV